MDPNTQLPNTPNDSSPNPEISPSQQQPTNQQTTPQQTPTAFNPTQTNPTAPLQGSTTQPQPAPLQGVNPPAKKHSLVRIIVIVVITLVVAAVAYSMYRTFSTHVQPEQATVTLDDANRRLLLNTAYQDMETYFNEYGVYPTQSDVTSSSFQSSNMRYTTQALAKQTEITGVSATLEDSTIEYTPSPAGCDNVTVDCTSYSLTVKLNEGTYTKNALNGQ